MGCWTHLSTLLGTSSLDFLNRINAVSSTFAKAALCSYLFVLCMELLGQKITKVICKDRWKPVRASRGGSCISHVFFSDDLILFGEA